MIIIIIITVIVIIIEHAKFTDCPQVKAFEKQTKTIEDQGEIQIE